MDFQLINRENIAREVFPDVWGEVEPFGDEAVRPIIRSKSDLSAYVAAWLERAEIASIKANMSQEPSWRVFAATDRTTPKQVWTL